MASKILITGATGTIGSDVVRLIAEKGIPIRAGVRTGHKEAKVRLPHVEIVHCDFDEPEALKRALEGMEKLFLLTPGVPQQVEFVHRTVDLAKEAGIRHIVRLSALGANHEHPITLLHWHQEAERLIKASGIPYTILRPSSFMQNIINFFPPRDGKILLPLGDGRVSYIDTRDIAAVAAVILTGDGKHEDQAYDLTGPEALSVYQVALILSDVISRNIEYIDVPDVVARQAMEEQGAPEWLVNGIMELHAFNREGNAAVVTPAIELITGRKATAFGEFARDYAEAFHTPLSA